MMQMIRDLQTWLWRRRQLYVSSTWLHAHRQTSREGHR